MKLKITRTKLNHKDKTKFYTAYEIVNEHKSITVIHDGAMGRHLGIPSPRDGGKVLIHMGMVARGKLWEKTAKRGYSTFRVTDETVNLDSVWIDTEFGSTHAEKIRREFSEFASLGSDDTVTYAPSVKPDNTSRVEINPEPEPARPFGWGAW